jgi:hypothetical protein
MRVVASRIMPDILAASAEVRGNVNVNGQST